MTFVNPVQLSFCIELETSKASTGDASFGVQNNQFGFNIVVSAGIPTVVKATTSLAGAPWTALQSCARTNGSIYFSDSRWAKPSQPVPLLPLPETRAKGG